MARSVFSTGLLFTAGVGSGAGVAEAVGLLVRLPDCAMADDAHSRNTIKSKSGRTGTVPARRGLGQTAVLLKVAFEWLGPDHQKYYCLVISVP